MKINELTRKNLSKNFFNTGCSLSSSITSLKRNMVAILKLQRNNRKYLHSTVIAAIKSKPCVRIYDPFTKTSAEFSQGLSNRSNFSRITCETKHTASFGYSHRTSYISNYQKHHYLLTDGLGSTMRGRRKFYFFGKSKRVPFENTRMIRRYERIRNHAYYLVFVRQQKLYESEKN